MNLSRLSNLPSSGDVRKEIARKSHLEYMDYTWPFSTPFLRGFHTIEICRAIDEAIEKYRRGESSYLLIAVPFRHGKSQILTRSLPPHFLGEFPEAEIISTAYNTSLAQRFSKDAKNILNSKEHKELYPECIINPNSKSTAEWSLDNELGKTLWTGLGGGLTGSGANLALVDDVYKDRAEANSETIRNTRWEALTESLMTRLAPVHIMIILGTPWHELGVHARIMEEMEKDPTFPRFDVLTFPAKAEDYIGPGGASSYPSKYLFPERFSDKWYEGQYATLGPYASSGLLDCNPSPRGGNLIGVEEGVNYHYVDEKPEGFGKEARAWDLASSSPKISNDPDWTIGVRGSVKVKHTTILDPQTGKPETIKEVSIYISDIIRIREEAIIRDRKMVWASAGDGPGCLQLIESFGAQKDTYIRIKNILGGTRIVKEVKLKGDKLEKISQHLEIPFSAGNVFINNKIPRPVVDAFLKVLGQFPGGAHDDDPDALTLLVATMSSSAYSAWWAQ